MKSLKLIAFIMLSLILAGIVYWLSPDIPVEKIKESRVECDSTNTTNPINTIDYLYMTHYALRW